MVQTNASNVPRRTGAPATAAVLLGAGLACAGTAHASIEAAGPPEVADVSAVATTSVVSTEAMVAMVEPPAAVASPVDLAAMPVAVALDAPVALASPPPAPTVAAKVAPSAAPAARPEAIGLVAAVAAAEPPVARRARDGMQDELGRAMDLVEPAPAQVAHARGGMAGWKPVAQARLDKSRGGFDVGGLQVGFGIDRAVYVNGALAVATSISIPDVSRITAAQAAQLQQALGGVAAAVAQANAAADSAVAQANAAAANARGQAGAAGAAAQANAAAAVAQATGAAGGSSSASSGSATGASSSATGAAGLPTNAVATATGVVSTNGLLSVVQNGPGNTANLGAMPNMPGTVIQNTLNNQTIQSLMTISATVNTLQAFRSQMANTALNSVIQRMR